MVGDYAERISRYARFELVELKASRRRSAAEAKAEEAAAIQRRISERDWIIALDERGEMLSSLELAAFLERAQNQSRDLLFVIGGDEGLSEAVLKQARLALSLSRLTLPHRLARIVLIEQVYRAFTLLRGEPYHK